MPQFCSWRKIHELVLSLWIFRLSFCLRAHLLCFELPIGLSLLLLVCCRLFSLCFVFALLIGQADATGFRTRRARAPLACTSVDTLRAPVSRSPTTIPSPDTLNPFDSFSFFSHLILWSTDATVAPRALERFSACFCLYTLASLVVHFASQCSGSAWALSICFFASFGFVSAPLYLVPPCVKFSTLHVALVVAFELQWSTYCGGLHVRR